MKWYSSLAISPSAWPEPMESVYQALPASVAAPSNARRPDISLADRLFMGAVVAIPRAERYGMVTWVKDAFRISRKSVYDIAARIHVGSGNADPQATASDAASPPVSPAESDVERHLIPRLILRMLLPGGMSYRPMRVCLREVFSQTRSLGYISELINRDGERAGQILTGLQWPDNPPELFLSRDETYFNARPMLLTVDPHSLVITGGHVEETADGESWAISLSLLLEGRGPLRVRISEDAASFYARSLTEAKLLLQEGGTECEFIVQKDVHHISDAANRVQGALDRPALKALGEMLRYERPSPRGGITVITNANRWLAAKKSADPLMALADDARFWIGSLHDAFEIVDLRSGEIRDFEINHWLLWETIKGLAKLDHPRTAKLVATITEQEPHLLTYMRWLDEQMPAWRSDCLTHFEHAELATLFERAAGRAWRLSRAVTNGHYRLRPAAERASVDLDALIGGDPVARELADRLIALLDSVVRTSCASENINSILKPLIWAHRYYPTRQSAQHFLNLFILWHCMRKFERGKRAGKSPFELAGVKVYTPDGRETTDWLEVLGYPAAA